MTGVRAIPLSLCILVSTTCGGPDRAGAGGGAGGESQSGEAIVRERVWPVMGTLFRVSASGPDSASVERGLRRARGVALRVDSLMSTYREDSEVSRINGRSGTGEWTRVSAWTLDVVRTSLDWARRSGGAFDPTVGPLTEAWGFRGGAPVGPPPPEVLDSVAHLVGYEGIEIDEAGSRVRLDRAGAALDFGAVAKGYALDRCVDALRDAGVVSGTVDLGGNLKTFGPAPDSTDGWRLGVRHPRRTRGLMGVLVTGSGSVATSGDYEQFFVSGGVRYAHILDPRTARPVRGTASVTVAARDGVTADVLSTLLFVLGPDAGRGFLAERGPPGGATVVWARDPGEGELHEGLVEVLEGRPGTRVELDLPEAPR